MECHTELTSSDHCHVNKVKQLLKAMFQTTDIDSYDDLLSNHYDVRFYDAAIKKRKDEEFILAGENEGKQAVKVKKVFEDEKCLIALYE